MPLKRLRVELGGLCMLVPRQHDRKGLYVLMPRSAQHGHVHCPMVVCPPSSTVSGRLEFRQLQLEELSDEIDLSDVAVHGEQKLPEFVARVSSFHEPNLPVAIECLDGVSPRNLAARVVLPIPTTPFFASGSKAKLRTPKPSTPGDYNPTSDFAGLCTVIFDVKEDHKWNLRIKGIRLRPDQHDEIRITLLNIRPKDLQGMLYEHVAGDTWEHPQAYHALLQGKVSSTGPRPIIAETIAGPPDLPDHQDCGDISFGSPEGAGPRFIDPYTCTLGGGCPPGEPAC